MNQTHQRLDLAGAGHQFTASAFFVAGEMTGADFLDYMTKGENSMRAIIRR
jgi:hypothetical protein